MSLTPGLKECTDVVPLITVKLLLVDDDESFASLLTPILNRDHYQVDVAISGHQGLEFLEYATYDLVLLDLELPDMSGVKVCQRLRERRDSTPILLLTSSDAQAVKIQALDAGADDYLVKSSEHQELLARIRALLRRNQSGAQPILTWGELKLDPSLSQVTYEDSILTLTAKEYEMLELFLRNPKQLFSAKTLLDRLWSIAEAPLETAVRTHIKELRRKLKQAGAENLIETIRGLGYRLRALPPSQTPSQTPSQARSQAQPQRPYQTQRPQLKLPAHHSAETDDTLGDALGKVAEALDANLLNAWKIARPNYLRRLQRMEAAIAVCNRPDSVSKAEWQQALQTLRHEAHTLKGGLGSFGLGQLAQLAQTIQQQAGVVTDTTTPTTTDRPTADPTTADPTTANLTTRDKATAPLLPLEPVLRQLQWGVSKAHPLSPKHSNSAPVAAGPQMAKSTAVCHWILLSDTDLSDRLCLQAPPGTAHIRCEAPTVEALTPDAIHIIWLDLEQPVSEIKAQGWFQAAQALPQVSLLVLSEQGDLASRLQASELGCDRFGLSSTPVEQLWSMATALAAHHHPLKLLIVDDDPGLLAQLEQDLAQTPVACNLLADPAEFWQVLEQAQPDVLVLDIEMSGINGIELCQAVRSDPRWRKLPVVFISVHSDRLTLQRLFEVQANDFLCKPVRGEALLKRALMYC